MDALEVVLGRLPEQRGRQSASKGIPSPDWLLPGLAAFGAQVVFSQVLSSL